MPDKMPINLYQPISPEEATDLHDDKALTRHVIAINSALIHHASADIIGWSVPVLLTEQQIEVLKARYAPFWQVNLLAIGATRILQFETPDS